jgi:hypothetical protein
MKLKTLLLGSAGALAVVGGAQAADLSVAEPVEYVKVCDAFGNGYWYIPGTDTCLKIGGYVQFDVAFHTAQAVDYAYSGTANPTAIVQASGYHSAAWEFRTEASLQVTAKSMTSYGPLTGYLEFRGKSDNANSSNNVLTGASGSPTSGNTFALSDTRFAYLDSAWLELGPLLVGRTANVYDYGGGYNFDGSDLDADQAADQIRLTWAMSGFGVMLGIDDPRDRWGTDLSFSYAMPEIVAAVTASQAHWDGKLSVGFAETTFGSGFGVQAAVTIKLNEIAKGDALRLKAAWAQSQVAKFTNNAASNSAGGSVWSALASFQHFWSPEVYSAVTFSYYLPSSAANSWSLAANLVWAPVTGFFAGVEGTYTVTAGAAGVWAAKVRVKRSW